MPVKLRRIVATKIVRRFYRLDVQPDLFGGVLLTKAWGRVGARGCKIARRYDTEALATIALQRQAERKRPGYWNAFPIPDAVAILRLEVLHDE